MRDVSDEDEKLEDLLVGPSESNNQIHENQNSADPLGDNMDALSRTLNFLTCSL